MIVSPYDTEARFSVKLGMEWIDYKVHLTDYCDEALPHLITHVETTLATVPDDQVLEPVHHALAQRELLSEIHLVDAGYIDAEGLVSSQRDYGITLMGPVAADPSWQTKAVELVQIEAGKSGTQAMHKRCISNTSVYDAGIPPQAGRVVIKDNRKVRMGA